MMARRLLTARSHHSSATPGSFHHRDANPPTGAACDGAGARAGSLMQTRGELWGAGKRYAPNFPAALVVPMSRPCEELLLLTFRFVGKGRTYWTDAAESARGLWSS